MTKPTTEFMTPFSLLESNSGDEIPHNLLIASAFQDYHPLVTQNLITVEDRVMSPIMAHWEGLVFRETI